MGTEKRGRLLQLYKCLHPVVVNDKEDDIAIFQELKQSGLVPSDAEKFLSVQARPAGDISIKYNETK